MPIRPDEVSGAKIAAIPDWVFVVWDRLITQAWNGRSATVRQSDAIRELHAASPTGPADIYNTGWLDIEDAYRAVGWKVVYDKPAYNESYPATFTFTFTKK